MTPEEIQDEIIVLEYRLGYMNSLIETYPINQGSLFKECLETEIKITILKINLLKA